MLAVAVAVALARPRAVGSYGDNSRDSDGGRPNNNQLKRPADKTMVAVMVTAMEIGMVT